MATKFWIVDTFSKDPFCGVPASVFFVNDFKDETLMQNVAMEVNSPETIFLKDLKNGTFESVCYTPRAKGLFFGNALYAAAKVINETTKLKQFSIICGIRVFQVEIGKHGEIKVRFSTVELNKASIPVNLSSALNEELIVSLSECKDELVIEIRSPKRLLNLNPNTDILKGINYNSFVITADTHYETDLKYDFCAKVFAPRLGVYHSITTPIACAKLAAYWMERMEKTDLVASDGEGERLSIKYTPEFTFISGYCSISTTGDMLAL